jgi:hypothetical protein
MFPELIKKIPEKAKVRKGRFTHAINYWSGRSVSKSRAQEELRDEGMDTCLVFDTDDVESVMRANFLYTFNKSKLWFVAVPSKYVIVSTQFPDMPLDAYSKATVKLQLPTVTHTIKGKELGRCLLLPRVTSGCRGCEYQYCMEKCRYMQLQRVAEDRGLPSDVFTTGDDDEGFDVDELKEMAPTLDWELVPPYRVVDDMFSSTCVPLRDISFDIMEEITEQRSARAESAAETRKAIKKCEKECHFAKHCYVLEENSVWAKKRRKPAAWAAVRCQRDGGGPVSQQEMLACLPHVLSDYPERRTRKEIEWVARNAGASTRLFGYELTLGRMHRGLNLVEMYRATTRERFRFRYEDVVTMLNTPYYADGRYKYPGVVDDVPEMSDEMLLSYIMLCDMRYLKTYNTAYLGVWATPRIYEVAWSPCADELRVTTFPGSDWRYTFRQLAQVNRAQDRYETIPSIIYSHLEKVRASAGMDSSETSSDKPL